tara:strand:- start:12 stop:164 length:153 start_codon:yes stop_codon:yes gene_type:complete
LKKKISAPNYVKDLVKKFPQISSGRKQFNFHHERVIKTIKIIKKFVNKKN